MKTHLFGSKLKFLAAAFLLLLVGLVLAVPGTAVAQSSTVTLTVLDSGSNPLDGIGVYYNDYGNHWVQLGTTSGGNPVVASLPAGTYKFKAVKDHTEQIKDSINVPGNVTFQTDKFTVHVNDSTGANFPGIAVSFNDYGNHYLSMGSTDANGDAFIELFPGTRQFMASKDHTNITGNTTSTITFQTAQFAVHVNDSSGAKFPGIAVSFNDYGNHYLSMGSTDTNGDAFIELFPGTRKFMAAKDHTNITGETTNAITFQTAKFTVHVNDSGGADFPGVAASFNDYGNHYLSMGNTDSNGNASIELFPGTYKFRAYKDHTDMTGDLTNDNAGTEETISFQTAKAVGVVKDCDGTPLEGFRISFNDYGNHWLNMGTTGPDGKASIELFPGTRTIRAWKDYTYEVKDLTLTLTESTVEFNPTKVDWQYSGTVRYNDYGNHWKTMAAPFYLFPGTYDFMFDGIQESITIGGCEMSGSVLLISLKDSAGNGVAGGTAHLGVGGWPVIGTTDANGNLIYFHNEALRRMQIRMDAPFYGGSETSPVQDTRVNSVFNFQTQQVTIQLKDSAGNLTDGGVVMAGVGGWPVIGTTGDDGPGTLYHEHFAGTFKYRMRFNSTTEEQQHDVSAPFVFQTVQAVIQLLDHNGNPLDGGTVRFGTSGWPVIGTTGDAGPGTVHRELFTGSYNFRMRYNYGTEQKNADISSPVIFQTALVDLQFSGSITHKVGGWPAYSGPTEMLPINHGFAFAGCGYPRQVLWFTPAAGTVLEKSIVYTSLVDSGGGGLVGGDFEYRFGWGSYAPLGTTPANGLLVNAIDGLHTNTKFRVSYAGGTMDDMQQNVATDSCVVFQTVPVTAKLMKSDNSGEITNGVSFEYRYGWDSKMPFTGSTELLPINTKMTVYYMGAFIEKEQNVGSNPDFVFTTKAVTAKLLESNGNDISAGATFEYRYGWGAKQPFTGPMDLLPVLTKITVYYKGASIEKEQNVASDENFVFNTKAVTAKLLDSNGNDISVGATFEYRYGWGTKLPFSGPTELLPVNTKITVHYLGAAIEKEQNVNTNPDFVFATVSVTSELKDSSGGDLIGSAVFEYRYGWGAYQSFSGSLELLPVNTKMRVSYAGGTTGDIQQNVGSNAHFSWQTGNVTSSSCTRYRYGWGSYMTFTSGMELLPLSTKFSDVDGPDVTATPVAGGTINVTCQ